MRLSKAFTLVELLVVVLVLGIIAAIIVPSFSDAAHSARSVTLMENLRTMRMQIQVFKAKHRDVPPGYPDMDTTASPTEEAFVAQLTGIAQGQGESQDEGDKDLVYGFLLREIPYNPVNNLSSVRVLSDDEPFPSTAANTHGYVYQPATATLRADSLGADEKGVAYFDY